MELAEGVRVEVAVGQSGGEELGGSLMLGWCWGRGIGGSGVGAGGGGGWVDGGWV